MGLTLVSPMLVTGGYVWTIVPLQHRRPYMAALEQASCYRNVQPLASFFAALVPEHTKIPLPQLRGHGATSPTVTVTRVGPSA